MSDSIDVVLQLDTSVDVPLGQPGTPGTPGKSAYQSWLDEGNTGSVADFLASLKGDGADPATIAAAVGTYLEAHPQTKADVGLANVDNTADVDKPVSVAQQAALDEKSDAGHSHSIADVTGLTDALGAKVDSSSLGSAAAASASDFATAAQGTKADAAAPASSVYDKTAADGRFATVAQGTKADSAVQPGSLGTAANLNAPASGNAATSEVVKGSDTRLSDPRTPTAHTHTASQISDFNAAADARVAAARPAAADYTKTTASLANGATETGTWAPSSAQVHEVFKVSTDRAARVRFYDSTAHLTADASRAVGTDPTGDHGLLLEANLPIGGNNYATVTIPAFIFEMSAFGAVPYSITNLSGSTSTVAVTIRAKGLV